MTDAVASFAPAGTRDGELPPWGVAKAVAYHVVLSDVSQFLETSAFDLVGTRVDDYIAGKVFLKGGGASKRKCCQEACCESERPCMVSWKAFAQAAAGQSEGQDHAVCPGNQMQLEMTV